MLSANFKPRITAAVSRCFLATARLSCFIKYWTILVCSTFKNSVVSWAVIPVLSHPDICWSPHFHRVCGSSVYVVDAVRRRCRTSVVRFVVVNVAMCCPVKQTSQPAALPLPADATRPLSSRPGRSLPPDRYKSPFIGAHGAVTAWVTIDEDFDHQTVRLTPHRIDIPRRNLAIELEI